MSSSKPPRPARRVLLALGAVALAFWLSLRSSRRRRVPRAGVPSPVVRTDEPSAPEGRSSARAGALAGVVLLVGLVVVLGVAPVSLLVDELPERTAGPTTISTAAPAVSGLREVPVGLPVGATIRTVDDVRPYAERALGPDRAAVLLTVLGSGEWLAGQVLQRDGVPEYPYTYPALEALLGDPTPAAVADWTALGAALTVLTAQQPIRSEAATAEQNAGPAAFAVLRRAVASGGCPAQLNLLLLLASDAWSVGSVLADQQRSAEAACLGDPTPGWVAGQAELRILLEGGSAENDSDMPTARAVSTMQRLVDAHPTDTAALTGLGDAYLTAAMSVDSYRPFSARRYFRHAVAAYNRAVDNGGHADAAVGVGRALIGLREPARAIELLAPSAAASPTPGPVLEVLVAAQEAAGRFADAERSARRLADTGAAAYPRGPALVPQPQRLFFSTLEDVGSALSLGADRLQPLRSRLVGEGGAGGFAQDLSFVPVYQDVPGLTGTHAACAGWTWRRNAVLAGHAAAALAEWSTANTGARPDGFGCDTDDVDPTRLRAVAEMLTGDGIAQDAAADDWQNLLRWAGDRAAARDFVLRWADARGERSDLPAYRLGEIDFLEHRYDDAAAWFAVAARRARLLRYNDDLGVARAQLIRAAALIGTGRSAEAEVALRRLSDVGITGFAFQASKEGRGASAGFAFLSYHASAQLADEQRQAGQLHAAVESYETALSWSGFDHPEVLHNNAALAYLGLDDTTRAAQLITQALREDPHNPVTLMTAGFIADRRHDIPAAAQFNERALDNDPGLYPAANDLGVQLARLDRPAEARHAFQRAVAARPDYALGWFNLGVLESVSGVDRVLAAQQALGAAYRLDPDLRDRQLELTIDGEVYRTALDLSKPLPAAWTFADLPRPAPAAAVGLLAVVGVGLALARAADRGAAENAEEWLEPVTERLEALPLIGRARAAIWGVAATLLTFFLAGLHHRTSATATVLYPVGLLVIVLSAMYARTVVGKRTGQAPKQRSWTPGIVVGVVAGAVGYPWAPIPVVDSTGRPNAARLHLAAPLVLAGIALVLFLESAWTRAPLTEAWASAALIMCASLLLPVGPLDGKHLDKAGLAMSAGVIGAALLFGLGLL